MRSRRNKSAIELIEKQQAALKVLRTMLTKEGLALGVEAAEAMIVEADVFLKKSDHQFDIDYGMEVLSAIPEEQRRAVFDQKDLDLDITFLGFLDIYEKLSQIIPKHFTIIDFGCSYNAQAYFFANHKELISVDIDPCVKFQPPNNKIFDMSIEDFIKQHGRSFKKKETFAICSYVPKWHNGMELIRSNFENMFIYYPHGGNTIKVSVDYEEI